MRLMTVGSDRKLFAAGSDVERRILEQSTLLESHLVIVFALRARGLTPRMIGTNVRVVPTNSRSRFLYFLDAARIGIRETRSFDLVTAQDPFEAGLAGYLTARLLRIPLQLQIHADIMSPYFRRASLLNRLRAILASVLIPRADSLRVVSTRIEKSLRKRFEPLPPMSVLPVFSREPRNETEGPLPKRPFILVASRLEREKGVDVAIRAFARLAPEFPDLTLAIAGEGRERRSLKTLARSLTLTERIVFLGWRNDILALMTGAAMYLHASPSEGFGLSLLEAARAGCPIVSTDVGIVGDVIPREDIIVVPVGDREGIAAGIRSALRDQNRASKPRRLQAKLPTPLSLDEYLKKLSNSWMLAIAAGETRHAPS